MREASWRNWPVWLLASLSLFGAGARGSAAGMAPRQSCWQAIQHFVGDRPSGSPRKVLQRAMGIVFKPIAYPAVLVPKALYFAGKALLHPRQIMRVGRQAFDSFRRDAIAISVYGAIYLGANLTSVTPRQINTQVPLPRSTAENIAFVNAFSPVTHEKMFRYTEWLFRTEYEKFPHAERVAASDEVELFAKLLAQKDRVGPLDRVEIHLHANPGLIAFAGTTDPMFNQSPQHFSAGQVRQAIKLATQFPKDRESHGKYDGYYGRMIPVYKRIVDEGIIRPGGMLIIYGCSCGRGESGVEFMKEFGGLFSNGPLTVYGSDTLIRPDVAEMFLLSYGIDPPGAMHQLEQTGEFLFVSGRLVRNVAEFVENSDDYPVHLSWNPVKRVELYGRKPHQFNAGMFHSSTSR